MGAGDSAGDGARDARHDALARLWLDTSHRIVARAAHEVLNALNGIAVNLEVVRSRAAKDGVPATSVAPFADAAVGQLEALTAMVQPWLGLARPVREPADVAVLLGQVVAVLAPAASTDGRRLALETPSDWSCPTRARGEAVRLATAAAVLAAVEGEGGDVCCRVERGTDVVVTVTTDEGGAFALPPALTAALAAEDIRIETGIGVLRLSFPGSTAHA